MIYLQSVHFMNAIDSIDSMVMLWKISFKMNKMKSIGYNKENILIYKL